MSTTRLPTVLTLPLPENTWVIVVQLARATTPAVAAEVGVTVSATAIGTIIVNQLATRIVTGTAGTATVITMVGTLGMVGTGGNVVARLRLEVEGTLPSIGVAGATLAVLLVAVAHLVLPGSTRHPRPQLTRAGKPSIRQMPSVGERHNGNGNGKFLRRNKEN